MKQRASADSTDQDQTAQTVQYDLESAIHLLDNLCKNILGRTR